MDEYRKMGLYRKIFPLPKAFLVGLLLAILLILFLVWFIGSNSSNLAQEDIIERNPCDLLLNPSKDGICNIESIFNLNSKTGLSTSSLLLYSGGNSVKRVKEFRSTWFVPPGRELKPWPLTLPLDWSADPYKDKNWQFHLHAWRMIDPMLVAWSSTNDIDYAKYALELITDWYDYHFLLKRGSKFQWYDMSVGLRAAKLAYIIQRVAVKDLTIDKDGYRMLLILAYEHARYLMDPTQLSSSNHGLFQLHGLMALCQQVPFVKTCGGYQKYVEHSLTKLLSTQFNQEGVHLEHSPEYHFFANSVVLKVLKSGWYNNIQSVTDLMDKVSLNKAYMVFPDKTIVTVGDSQARKRANAQFPQGKDSCIERFMNDEDCYFSKMFFEAGYGVVRSDWAVPTESSSMLFFMGMFHSSAHKLPDDLSFEWFDQGRRILTNAGKYSYDKDEFRRFVKSTRAHNTIEINQSNFKVTEKYAYGSALEAASRDEGIFKIRGKVIHKGLGTTHTRNIYYLPRKWLIVSDDFSADSMNEYTQWFHFDSSLNVDAADECSVKAEEGDGKFVLLIKNFSDKCSYEILNGQTEPRLQGWVTSSYGKMEKRFSLGFTKEGEDSQLITAFAFSDELMLDAEKYIAKLSFK